MSQDFEGRAKHYYGFRRSTCPSPEDNYWSSSQIVQTLLKKYGTAWFKKKILAVYLTSAEALAHEVWLHTFLNVQNNPTFLNQANQTSTKFLTPG